ncbi:MAG: hypothetical protein ACE5GB_04470 [Acidimicrobiales bacterium]
MIDVSVEVDETGDEVVHPIALVRRWWPLFLAAVVLGAAAGWVATGRIEQTYETDVLLLVGPVAADPDVLRGTAELARTYGEMAESRSLIEAAVAGTGVEPRDVDILATTERRSSTLDITIRTPDREATLAVASGLTDALRELVGSQEGSTVTTVGGQPVAIGSELLVLNPGGGRVRSIAVGREIGAAIGVLIGLFTSAAVALSVDVRGVEAQAQVVARHTGNHLGTLHLPPRLATMLAKSRRTALSIDSEALHDARLVGHHMLQSLGERPGRRTIFVTSATADLGCGIGLLQLLAGCGEPTTVLDPTRLFRTHTDIVQETPGQSRFQLHALQDPICDLVTWDEEATAELEILELLRRITWSQDAGSMNEARQLLERNTPEKGLSVVYVPTSHLTPSWRHWASIADGAVVLADRRHATEHSLAEIVARVTGVGCEVLGGVNVDSRWVTGRWAHCESTIPRLVFEPRVDAGRTRSSSRWGRVRDVDEATTP